MAVDLPAGKTAYAGAMVRRGEAIAEVTATGTSTYFGRAAELVRIAHVESAELKVVLALGSRPFDCQRGTGHRTG